MKINLGCGSLAQPGFVNVDSNPSTSPDRVVDPETLPWPWEDGSITDFRAHYVLETLYEGRANFFQFWQELFRVVGHDARIDILARHPGSSFYRDDYRCVRPITAALIQNLFHRGFHLTVPTNIALCKELGINFSIESINYEYFDKWARELKHKGQSEEDIQRQALMKPDVVRATHIILRANKKDQAFEEEAL